MTGGREDFRAGIEAQRPAETGGGLCTVLVLRVGGRVLLLHHGMLSAAAQLTDAQAVELAAMLQRAAAAGPAVSGL